MPIPKKKRRIQILITAAGCIVVATVLIGYGFRDGITYFRLPTDILTEEPESDELFRLGGLVSVGSVIQNESRVEFVVEDEHNAIKVEFAGILPDLFAEGQGVIALGRYNNQLFTATEVLAKHDETYMPKEVADALKKQGLFQPLEE